MHSDFAGMATGPVIRIREAYRDDVGLQKHEELHVAQFFVWILLGALLSVIMVTLPQLASVSLYWPLVLVGSAGVHAGLYTFVWRYRLWAEVQCYRRQASYYRVDQRRYFANRLWALYDLGQHVTEAEIYKLLTR